MPIQSLRHVQVFATAWTVACQAPLSMEFPKQEFWTGWPFPSPGDLPNPGIEPTSPAFAGKFFTPKPLGKPYVQLYRCRHKSMCVCLCVCVCTYFPPLYPVRCKTITPQQGVTHLVPNCAFLKSLEVPFSLKGTSTSWKTTDSEALGEKTCMSSRFVQNRNMWIHADIHRHMYECKE